MTERTKTEAISYLVNRAEAAEALLRDVQEEYRKAAESWDRSRERLETEVRHGPCHCGCGWCCQP